MANISDNPSNQKLYNDAKDMRLALTLFGLFSKRLRTLRKEAKLLEGKIKKLAEVCDNFNVCRQCPLQFRVGVPRGGLLFPNEIQLLLIQYRKNRAKRHGSKF